MVLTRIRFDRPVLGFFSVSAPLLPSRLPKESFFCLFFCLFFPTRSRPDDLVVQQHLNKLQVLSKGFKAVSHLRRGQELCSLVQMRRLWVVHRVEKPLLRPLAEARAVFWGGGVGWGIFSNSSRSCGFAVFWASENIVFLQPWRGFFCMHKPTRKSWVLIIFISYHIVNHTSRAQTSDTN